MKRVSLLLLLSSFISIGMGSCTPSVEEACRTRIPELNQEIVKATEQVAYQVSMATELRHPDRAIASVAAVDTATLNRSFALTRDEKDKWQDWVERRLVEAEDYLDIARARTELTQARVPLADLTRELVAFDGYVERGQLYRMAESLQRVENQTNTAIRLVCESVSTSK